MDYVYARVSGDAGSDALTLVLFFIMVAVIVNLDIIGPLFLRGEGYEMGLQIVPILLLGYLFLGIYYNLSIWFKLTDKTQYSFYITLIGAVITVLVIFSLIPLLGFMGAALSTLLSYLTMSIVCNVVGQKHYPIPYKVGKGIFYLATAFILGYLGFLLEFQNPLFGFFVRNLFVLAYGVIIILMEKKELSLILQALLGNMHYANKSNQ